MKSELRFLENDSSSALGSSEIFLHKDPDSAQTAAGYLSLQLRFVEEKEFGIKELERNTNK